MTESNFRGWQKAQWLEKAVCPECAEQNRPHAKQLIELHDDGEAECGVCSATWRPDNGAIRGDSKL